MSSILDVAREAKVAPSTVSLVANRKGKVSDDTRKRVQAAMRRLGYRGRAERRAALRIGVVYTPNLLVNGTLVEYCRKWIQGLQRGFSRDGSHVSVFAGAKHVNEDVLFLQSLEAHDFDGLIMMGAYPHTGYVQRALDSGVPLVVFNQMPCRHEFSSVSKDIFGGARLAIQRLAELGHRRIVSQIWDNSEHNRLAAEAVRTTAAELGLDLHQLTPDDDFSVTADRILATGATAVFSGDPAAQKLADLFYQRGIDIPRQISILGIDDIGLTTTAGLRLTSLGYDKRTMGELAASILRRLIDMGDRLVNMTAAVPMHVVEGQTLGPAGGQS